MFEIIDGFIEEVNVAGELTVSPRGKRAARKLWIEKVIPLNSGDLNGGAYLGSPCVCIGTAGKYYLLGIYKTNRNIDDIKIPLKDGEKILWAGEYRGISLLPNGDMGLVSLKEESDGTISREPILYYNKDKDTIVIQTENILLGILGANTRGNLLIEQDSTGNIAYVFEGKTNIADKAPRFRLSITNPVTGVNTDNISMTPECLFNLKVDNIPLPIGVADMLQSDAVNIGIGAHKNGMTGISIEYASFCSLMMGKSINDPTKLFKISTYAGSSIEMNNTGDIKAVTSGGQLSMSSQGEISLSSPLGISLKISPDGTVSLNSPKKIQVVSPEISLKGKININTLPGAPGFCKVILCPMTGIGLTTNEVTSGPA